MMAFNVVVSDRIDLKYLTGLLNSDVIRFWLRHRGKMQGHNFQVDKEPLLAVPLHCPPKHEQQRIAKLVDRVIEWHRDLREANTASAQERSARGLGESEEALQLSIGKLYGFSAVELESLRADWAT